MEFRVFLEHFPNVVLKGHHISRTSFFAVGMSLAQHCDYETGTRVRPTQMTLAADSGCDRKTVRKVLALLTRGGAIEIVGHQRHHSGTPSAIYQFRRSKTVDQVLAMKNRHWVPARVSEEQAPTQVPEWGTSTHLSESTPHLSESTPLNKSRKSNKNQSVAKAPSPPSSLSPSGRDEESEEKVNWIDVAMASGWSHSDGELDRILNDL